MKWLPILPALFVLPVLAGLALSRRRSPLVPSASLAAASTLVLLMSVVFLRDVLAARLPDVVAPLAVVLAAVLGRLVSPRVLGIGGVVTYKKSGLDAVVSEIPLEHIVLETDAPYLAPVPHRGKRNLPAYLRFVAEKVALVKEIPLEEVARITTENSKRIFGI